MRGDEVKILACRGAITSMLLSYDYDNTIQIFTDVDIPGGVVSGWQKDIGAGILTGCEKLR